MRQYYRIVGKIESGLGYLWFCLLISLFGMFFVSELIGGMGGIPTFAGLLSVFYIMRIGAVSKERISHQLALSSRQEIRYLMAGYGIGYLLVWIAVKLLLMFAHMMGWGNMDGLTAKSYFESIYGSSLLERWAYLAAGILMFVYVMSLFPLVIIRKRRDMVLYFLGDTVLSAGVCGIIGAVCRVWIEEKQRVRPISVLDDLLLCRFEKYQAVLFIAAVLLLLAASVISVGALSIRFYGPKAGNCTDIPMELKELSEEERRKEDRKRKKSIIIICTAGAFLVLGTALSAYGIICIHLEQGPAYHKAAECLTEDEIFGPAVYNNEVYMPIDKKPGLYEDEKAIGYFAYKGQNCESRFYQIAIANLLYIKEDENGAEYLERYGADRNCYRRASSLESEAAWQKDEVFILWDEEWAGENSYGEERAGYTVCDRSLIENLEAQYGEVIYHPEDFSDYDAYFTISGYADFGEVVGDELRPGHWVGCILVRNNEFYYGSYENHIEGICLNQLLDTLGGN